MNADEVVSLHSLCFSTLFNLSILQGILRRLHNEGVQVLSISELELLNRRQSQGGIPADASLESMKAGWENERQSMISTIQSLKDLLAQTHKLRGLDKVQDSWLVQICIAFI